VASIEGGRKEDDNRSRKEGCGRWKTEKKANETAAWRKSEVGDEELSQQNISVVIQAGSPVSSMYARIFQSLQGYPTFRSGLIWLAKHEQDLLLLLDF
jgi:hypothetical protein